MSGQYHLDILLSLLGMHLMYQVQHDNLMGAFLEDTATLDFRVDALDRQAPDYSSTYMIVSTTNCSWHEGPLP